MHSASGTTASAGVVSWFRRNSLRLKPFGRPTWTLAQGMILALVIAWAASSVPHFNGSRLIAFQAAVEPATCSWMADEPLPQLSDPAAYQRSQVGFASDASAAADAETVAARKPLTWIRDPNASFSNVIVDQARDEVILLDANRFDILVYDRLSNTPSSAARTQPKRKIGGPKTLSQYASDIYVDQANGDIYAINNDSLRGMNVFSTRATGDVAPDRHFDAPYGSFGLNVDEKMQELFVSVQHDSAIGVWPKGADGTTRPIRSLQGDRTGLADPHGIAFDLKNRLMFVANFGTSRLAVPGRRASPDTLRIPHWPAGTQLYRNEVVPGSGKFEAASITVYPMNAQGNTAPLRVIQGPKTLLSWPTGISVDSEHGELYVANDTGDSITVYSVTADGNVAPTRVLGGPHSLIKNPLGVYVDVAHDEVWVANYGNHMATVYRRTASGDTPPLRVIRSAPPEATATMISNPFEIAYDPTRQEILVPSCVQHPRIAAFARTADADAAAVRMIQGQNTFLNRTVHGIGYDEIHDEIVVNSNIGQAVLIYRGGADGDESPIRIIQGPKTGLIDPVSVAVDQVHGEIFVFQRGPGSRQVRVFDRMAHGDVAPKRVLNVNAGHGAVDPVHDLLVVPGEGGLLIFDRTAEGDAEPKAKIGGVRARAIEIYPPTGKIVANISGGRMSGEAGYVGVWSIHDNGDDVPPEWTLGKGVFRQMRGLTLDPANKTVIVSDKYWNGVLTFALPEMYTAVADLRTRAAVDIQPFVR